ncbi:MAG: DUF4834 family protein [Bacteroidales bacterium]
MGLIRFVFIFFLVYFIISLFTRYVLPFVMRYFVNRMSDRVRRDYEKKMREKRRREREGEITIRYRPGSKKIITEDDGEYIDYEELDDK